MGKPTVLREEPFAGESPTPAPNDGLIAMKGGNCSFGGTEYVAVGGVVRVPAEAVPVLTGFGFQQV